MIARFGRHCRGTTLISITTAPAGSPYGALAGVGTVKQKANVAAKTDHF